MIIKGSKKITCLVNERKIPRFAFPIAVKKFAVIGCNPLIKVQNKKILKNFSAKRKYASLSEPKIPMICRGNSWKQIKETVLMIVAEIAAFK